MPDQTGAGRRHSTGGADGVAVAGRDSATSRRGTRQSRGGVRRIGTVASSMLPRLATRIVRTTDWRCLAKFAWNFGFKGMVSVEKFKRRVKRGEYFPPFLYLSIINSCNLRCQGCWVDVEAERESIDLETLNRTIIEAKRHGNAFFGILGGEPFMHPQVLDLLAAHPDCYFQVFTNGQFITGRVAEQLRKLGNTTPLVSIEGREIVRDERRGRKEAFKKTQRGLEHWLRTG